MIRIPENRPLSPLRDYLLEAGYTTEGLARNLGLEQGLRADLQNLQPLLQRTSADDLLSVLARLLFVGWPVPSATCTRHIPLEIIELCLDCGIFVREDSELSPVAVLIPFTKTGLFACDAPRLRGGRPDVVLGPSPVTRLFTDGILRNHPQCVLDIGTGCGVLSLFSAPFSERVIGTDINERAVTYARFNAALNGIKNVEFLAGDALAPVEGKQFTHIVANPPFFIGQSKRLTYSDSPMELDGFVRKLAIEAPQLLEENGVFQMIGEWVQIEGQPWQDRLQSWTGNSGCDVFILLGPISKPFEYSERRSREAGGLYGPTDGDLFTEKFEYLRNHGVEYVLSGIFTLRKRRGKNWFVAIDGYRVERGGSEAIQEQLDCLTLLNENSDEDWLNSRLRLSPDSFITQSHALTNEGWTVTSMQIDGRKSLFTPLTLDPDVVRAVEMFDGTNTVRQIAAKVHEFLGCSREDAESRTLALAKRLVQSAYVLPVRSQVGIGQE
jgi:hypothetical protein